MNHWLEKWCKKVDPHNPERPIYFYSLAAYCHIKYDIFYFGNFEPLNVAGGKNDYVCLKLKFYSASCELNHFFLEWLQSGQK